jgi:hypothetical protein
MPAMAYLKAKAGPGLVYYNAFIVRYGFVQTTLVAITIHYIPVYTYSFNFVE